MTNDFLNELNEYGSTERTYRGPKEYVHKTIHDMHNDVKAAAEDAIAELQKWNVNESVKFSSRMLRKCRNGVAVKVGYGSNNHAVIVLDKKTRSNGETVNKVEKFFEAKGHKEEFLENLERERRQAIAYLSRVIEGIEAGKLDGRFEEMLQSYRDRQAVATKRAMSLAA